MPDLFHFNQTLAQKAGAFICKTWSQAKNEYERVKSTDVYYRVRQPFEYKYYLCDGHKNIYRENMELIHKTIHAFEENGCFKNLNKIERILRNCIVNIDEQLVLSKSGKRVKDILKEPLEKDKLNDGLSTKSIQKLHDQIPDILAGVDQWQKWTMERIDKFADFCMEKNMFNNKYTSKATVKKYLLNYLIPMLYWTAALNRTPPKKRNKALRQYYKNQINLSSKKYKSHVFTIHLSENHKADLKYWANRISRSFQRSSSQVEGRNGYLAFVHRANRGMPEQRLKTLTVVHNFDIRSYDGLTPAERLFEQEFPDLFEFVLENVTGFPEPRKVRGKPLIVSFVRA